MNKQYSNRLIYQKVDLKENFSYQLNFYKTEHNTIFFLKLQIILILPILVTFETNSLLTFFHHQSLSL